MQIKDKKILMLIILIIIVVLFVIYYYAGKTNKVSIIEEKNEIEYAQILIEDTQKKPFISKLPIKTNAYSIIYSSLNKNVVVIFKKTTETIEDLRLRYQNEIDSKLQGIGYDQMVVWKVQN